VSLPLTTQFWDDRGAAAGKRIQRDGGALC